jgi:hypothetical protein
MNTNNINKTGTPYKKMGLKTKYNFTRKSKPLYCLSFFDLRLIITPFDMFKLVFFPASKLKLNSIFDVFLLVWFFLMSNVGSIWIMRSWWQPGRFWQTFLAWSPRMQYIVGSVKKTSLNISKGVIISRKSKKDRQYNGQIDKQWSIKLYTEN